MSVYFFVDGNRLKCPFATAERDPNQPSLDLKSVRAIRNVCAKDKKHKSSRIDTLIKEADLMQEIRLMRLKPSGPEHKLNVAGGPSRPQSTPGKYNLNRRFQHERLPGVGHRGSPHSAHSAPRTRRKYPKFEAASVKRADRCSMENSIDPGRIALIGDPLKVILKEAFNVKMDQIVGPSWLDTDCYSVVATMPSGCH